MAIIRRCAECRRWYLAAWSGCALRFRDEDGRQIGRAIHGHADCLARRSAPPETVPQLAGDELEQRLQRIEAIVSATDGGESPFGWRTGP